MLNEWIIKYISLNKRRSGSGKIKHKENCVVVVWNNEDDDEYDDE